MYEADSPYKARSMGSYIQVLCAFIKSYMEHEPADQDANEWRVWEIGKEIANRMGCRVKDCWLESITGSFRLASPLAEARLELV
uniref:Uncharacterized protein n=1 Tax=Lactuca sativa TaxID=4236 RepID=A0A9R1VS49_LACSA|nr:hypothetical protein LSAT_V11C400215450 [Lactuca sativa]